MGKVTPVIDRHGNKKVLVSVRLSSGQRIREMMNREEAERLLAEEAKIKKARTIGLMIQPNLEGRLKLRDAMHEYREDVIEKRTSKVSRANSCSYLSSMYDHLHVDLGLQFLDEITEAHMAQWQQKLLKQVGPRTVNSRMAAMHAFYNWCIRKRKLTEAPTRFIPKLKFIPGTRQMWTEEQVAMITLGSRLPYRHYIQIVHRTGARPKEMGNLVRSSLDFEAKVIKFHCGKNARGGDREFPMDEAIEAIFLEVIRRLPANEDRLFPFTESAVQQYLAHLKKQMGIDEPISLYGLRHGFATELIESGVDVFTAQRLLGHADLKTTRNYVRTHLSTMRKAVEELGRQRESSLGSWSNLGKCVQPPRS